MRSLVVLFAVAAVACAAPHEVEKRSIGHAVAYSYPAAVAHQSRVDYRSSPAVPVVAAPVVEARALYAAPAAVSHQSRVDYRSSPAVYASAPVVEARALYAAPAAVSHQSRVDYRSSPAVYAPVIAEPVVYAAPVATQYVGGSAVTHQSRVDVQSSPAVVAEHVVGPAVVEARSAWAPSVYASAW